MAENKINRSLTFKLMAVMCAAFLGAVITFLAAVAVGDRVIQQVYLSNDSVARRLNSAVGDFRDFVFDNQISTTDVNAIGRWNQEHPGLNLTVYGGNTTITSTPAGAELVINSTGIIIPAEVNSRTGKRFPVNFMDGVYDVVIYDASRGMVDMAVLLSALGLAALVFLVTVLLYDQHVTRSVQTLSRQVRQVSRGDLQMKIQPMTNDEIGQLALDVDAMRLSIIDKLQREEAAWQANSQLITAISHDVRTPLTALLGYLEILSDEGNTPEERAAYLEVCKNNAHRLKSLTDELFGFFLVFGRPEPEKVMEEFDAATLLDQILLEHIMDLGQRGFEVENTTCENLRGTLQVDLGHFRRIFDNLFSNVRKYADPRQKVTVTCKCENEELLVTITNHFNPHQTRVESNRIGLQTCNKLVSAMGGEFNQSRTKTTFTVEVLLPLYPAAEAEPASV